MNPRRSQDILASERHGRGSHGPGCNRDNGTQTGACL